MTMVDKIAHGFIHVEVGHFFSFCSDSRTRSHRFKIASTNWRLEIMRHWFALFPYGMTFLPPVLKLAVSASSKRSLDRIEDQ
jgi:hypothetical protein